MSDLEQLQKSIGYRFRNLELLRQSLTHPSYIQVNPRAGEHNQRLEFLGDAVFSLTLAEKLYQEFVSVVEGLGVPTATGRFRTHMAVSLVNDGPVTILVESSA